MAGSRICHSPRRNFLPGNEDELVGSLPGALIKGSNSPTPFPTVLRAPTPAFTLSPTPTPTSTSPLTNELFKQFMKTYLESNQGPSQSPAKCKLPLKAKMPDLYYDKSYIDYYYFCQQYKDHFKTFWAIRTYWTLFITSFFCRNISVQWT